MNVRLVEVVGFDASALRDRQELTIAIFTPTRGPQAGKRLLKLSSFTSEFLTIEVRPELNMNDILQAVQIMIELERGEV